MGRVGEGGMMVNSPLAFTSDVEKEQILRLLSDEPLFVPDLWGYVEPLKSKFSAEEIPRIILGWTQNVFWKRKRSPKAEGSAWSDWSDWPKHGWLVLDGLNFHVAASSIVSFLERAANALVADFGVAHMVAPHEIESGQASKTVMDGNLGVTTHQLRKYIPDLYWVTVFGEPYVELFGKERLLSVPAYLVKELDYGGVWIQLCESPLEFVSDYERVNRSRQQAKEHLGLNAFFDFTKWLSAREVTSMSDYYERRQDLVVAENFQGYVPPNEHQYDVPDFKLRERRREMYGF